MTTFTSLQAELDYLLSLEDSSLTGDQQCRISDLEFELDSDEIYNEDVLDEDLYI